MGTTSVEPVRRCSPSEKKTKYMLNFSFCRSIFFCVWCRCLVVLYYCHICLISICTFIDLFFFFNIILKSILIFCFIIFQLVQKSTHKTYEKSIPTYDDDDEYQTGGGSTVHLNILFLFNFFFFYAQFV
jgi:hypothetical protein